MMGTQVLLEEQDIAEALQLLTNEEAVDIIRNIRNKNLSAREFTALMKETFPDIDDKQSSKIQKASKEFLNNYDSKIKTVKLRVERNLCPTGREGDYIDDYKISDTKLECNICEKTFEKKKEINKHIKTEHKKKDIEEYVKEDPELLNYKCSPFFWPYIKAKEKAPLPQSTQTEEELRKRIEIDKKDKIHKSKRIKVLEQENDALRQQKETVTGERNALLELQMARNETEDEDLETLDEDYIDNDDNGNSGKGFEVPPGKELIILERQSSITDKAYHGTKVSIFTY